MAAAVVVATAVQAQSSDQLNPQNLTLDQQQAILRQATRGASIGTPGGSAAAGRIEADKSRTAADEAARRIREDQSEPEPLIPVLRPNDIVLVQVDVMRDRVIGQQPGPVPPNAASQPQFIREPVVFEPEERRKLEDLVTLIRSRNPYKLDRDGQLGLPGFGPIALGGLTEQQSMQRLAAEPVFLKMDVKIVRLPLAKTGVESLKRFGYDLFDDAPSTFAPVTDVPVPTDYVVGPGDELNVQLFGSQNRNLRLVVSREGSVSFPELGPIRVSGQTFSAVKNGIESRVAQQMIGVRASVSMGDIRSIRVFVLGEARRPGSYTVSGLATMTAALFASGGVKPIGSLRDIQLKRQGAVVRHMDLYDLLIRGDTSDDGKLLPGDVIFIPPVGPTVSVQGEVKRPAIYELRGENDATDVLAIAGGLTPDADASRGSLTRVDDQSRRVVLDLNFSVAGSRTQKLRNGDVLRVARLRPQLDSGVVVDGFVYRPGPKAWHEGLRLSDVITSVDELKPNADQNYILIRREKSGDRRIEVLSADLTAALSARGSAADPLLQPRDQITVFDLAPGRERIIKPLLDEIRLQSGISRPTEVVHVEGKVKAPGEYPLEPGMRVSDLLRAGGNLEASAFGSQAELVRYEVTEAGSRLIEVVPIDLAATRRGDAGANLQLRPYDYLLIKETPSWSEDVLVTLAGEVRFPGSYPIRRGETLHQVLNRAGGLTAFAYPKASAFTRQELKQVEQKQLDLLTDRLQSDLASLSLQAAAANQAGASQSMSAGQSLLGQLRQAKAVGRLVIDLQGILDSEPGSARDVVLKNGDLLVVPSQKQEVSVIGEVQGPSSHLYRKSLDLNDYVEQSGGLTRKADKKKIYVARADGSVEAEHGSLFRRTHDVVIQPGDTIVVPLDTERIPKLPFWQSITQIVYNLAVSLAAIKTTL